MNKREDNLTLIDENEDEKMMGKVVREVLIGFAILFVIIVIIITITNNHNSHKVLYIDGAAVLDSFNTSQSEKRLFAYMTNDYFYLPGYFINEDGGRKLFQIRIPKCKVILYYDLKNDESCYAEFDTGILGG